MKSALRQILMRKILKLKQGTNMTKTYVGSSCAKVYERSAYYVFCDWLCVRNFILATMGQLETAEIHVPQLFKSVSKHSHVGGHSRKP